MAVPYMLAFESMVPTTAEIEGARLPGLGCETSAPKSICGSVATMEISVGPTNQSRYSLWDADRLTVGFSAMGPRLIGSRIELTPFILTFIFKAMLP